MASRRSFLRDLALLLPALAGCSANRSPTAVCTVGLRNFDRERHRFHVWVVADDETLTTVRRTPKLSRRGTNPLTAGNLPEKIDRPRYRFPSLSVIRRPNGVSATASTTADAKTVHATTTPTPPIQQNAGIQMEKLKPREQ